MCRGAGCREICEYARRWCSNCWAKLSDGARENITQTVSFLASHPGDRAASYCLPFAIAVADRELERLARR